uniref:Uncharacterized protein n=1 Tax=Glossina austeni TaxID=7395 RepID=A0A1A9UR42_GLOAU
MQMICSLEIYRKPGAWLNCLEELRSPVLVREQHHPASCLLGVQPYATGLRAVVLVSDVDEFAGGADTTESTTITIEVFNASLKSTNFYLFLLRHYIVVIAKINKFVTNIKSTYKKLLLEMLVNIEVKYDLMPVIIKK